MRLQIPDNLKKRKIFDKIIPFIDNDKILLLTGARQAGKTSLLYLFIKELLKKGVSPEQIGYFDLENVLLFQKMNRIKDFDNFVPFLKGFGLDFKKKIYIFIDEVQYLDEAAGLLKYFADHYKGKIKFIVSGSSSLEIKRKMLQRLTGRVYRFEIMPLDFQEYLSFGKTKSTLKIFEEFCVFGSYPAVALLSDDLSRQKELTELYSLYVKRDIQDYAGVEDSFSFNSLVKLLAVQTGGLLNELELANTLAISRQTVKKYLFLLENTYVINLLTPFFTNKRKELTKMPKVYFIDPGLQSAVLENFSPLDSRADAGHLIENIIFLEIYKKIKREEEGQLFFWRTQSKKEVDFVISKGSRLWPIEVKYKSFKKAVIPRHLRDFISQYLPNKAFLITKDYEKRIKFGKTEVFFIPAHLFCEYQNKW